MLLDLKELKLDNFLEGNRISQKDWSKANISYDTLKQIAIDHKNNTPSLDDAASFLAKILQTCVQVHSVRWRVKNPEHLMEKIVRKRSSESEKYLSIDVNNYTAIVTDLVGVRVLHLFKYEWKEIQDHIVNSWELVESPIAYIRSGDEGSIIDSYKENNCDVKDHPAGYRSIHYVISTQPTKSKIISEIQVRTIFEEGWSEIDHKIRYPNFSDNELIAYFLTIFNRMAGSADEMGSFVKDLTAEISIQKLKLVEISSEQEVHLSKIESLAAELSNEKKQSKTKDSKLNSLNEEIQKLRNNSEIARVAAINTNGLAGSAARLAGLNTDLLGKGTLAKIAAMNASGLNDSVARLVGLNTDLLGNGSLAKIAAMNASGLNDSITRLAGLNAGGLGNGVLAKIADSNNSDSEDDDTD